ncbi:F-box/LRR-repeat protein At3g26922-like [Salvia hispanica]|uniref:F-box/LRR-repeat protein At3g26922-like n=1 Tax=Salvia hispanica TaxID=49212 RepID=UPI002009BA30|nr:F-box/LRR-repeat protein At3g26922-like [Salvia hispanica]
MDSNQLEPFKRKKKRQKQPQQKKKQGNGVVVDRISELPDDILFTILSFLSTREAAATSILSSRWPNLWKHTPNLDLFNRNYVRKTTEIEHTSWDFETCQNVKMVNSALESHQAPCLKQFRICFYINKSAQSTITKWLEFVWSRQVERLELSFSCLRQKQAVVLEDMLGEMRPMKHLRELCLINMKVSSGDISLFLRNCPLLKKLTIRCSTLTSDVYLCGTTLMLEYLQLHYCILNESIINISAPYLSEVKIDAYPGQLWFKNVPKLVVATFMHHFAFEVCCITSQHQKLTLSLSYTENIVANSFPQMPNLKELIIRDSSLYKHGFLTNLKMKHQNLKDVRTNVSKF